MTALDIMRARLPEDDAVTAAEAEEAAARKVLREAEERARVARGLAADAHVRAWAERRHNALRALAEEVRALGVEAATDGVAGEVVAVIGEQRVRLSVQNWGGWQYATRWDAPTGHLVPSRGTDLRAALRRLADDIRARRWKGEQAVALRDAIDALVGAA